MAAPARASHRLGRRIRRRALWTFLAYGLGAGASWYYREAIFAWLLVPGGGMLSPYGGLPVFTAPTDMMSATIRLALRGGAVAALPVLAVSVFTLVRPWLPSRHRRFLTIFLPAMALFFAGGAAFAYYVMLPTGMRFLLHFGDGVAVPLISITEYLALLTAMMFWLGIVFELPLAMFLLARMGIVSRQRMKRVRKFVPLTAFILGMILTPTVDIVNQTLVALPIILLYEVGLILALLGGPRKRAT